LNSVTSPFKSEHVTAGTADEVVALASSLREPLPPSLAGLRGGFDSDQPFLAKPFTTIELASLVRKVLDG
jgi:hypothetical protein